MSRFVVVPQWQGSGSSRAMQLVDGAAAIAGDLPRASCTPLEVPLEAGESLGSGVRRLSSLVRVREALERELADVSEPTIVVGGDCGVALGAVSAIASSDLALVWFDAHADLNTPESSPSGAFGGMVLRALLGDAPSRLALPTGTITTDRVVLAGSTPQRSTSWRARPSAHWLRTRSPSPPASARPSRRRVRRACTSTSTSTCWTPRR